MLDWTPRPAGCASFHGALLCCAVHRVLLRCAIRCASLLYASCSVGRPPRRWLVGALSFAVCAAVALPRPACGSSLDALDPFDPGGSDAWQGPLVPTALYTPAEPLPRSRGPWLGVGGGMASSPGERRRLFALVELGIPLDDVAGAGLATTAPDDEVDDADERASEVALDAHDAAAAAALDAEWSGLVLTGAAPGLAEPSSAMPPSRRAPLPIAGQSAPFGRTSALGSNAGPAGSSTSPGLEASGAPSLPRPLSGCSDARSCDPAALMPLARATVAEALHVQGGQAELRRLDGMAARSRAAASLPEVRFGAGTSRDESLRLAPTAADPARFTRDGGRDLWLEARLTWRLDSAIFARDEIAIMRLRAQQREELARLTADVLEALVAFERAGAKLSSELTPSDERDQALIVQFGALARLDVLTDGWFSRQLERARNARR